MNINESIGKRIKDRRKELEINQSELALKVGLKDKSSISKIESGKRGTTRSQIQLFADALETTPSYIMGWDDEDNSSHEEFSNPIDAFRDDVQTLIRGYCKLDELDQAKIQERISVMLEDEKYSKQDGLKNA